MTLNLFTDWAMEPSREGLGRLQDAIQSLPSYDVYDDLTGAVAPLLDEGRFAAARSLLVEALPEHVLGPGTHALLAGAHRGLGDEGKAEAEMRLAELTLSVILHSGDGTPARPYVVLHTSDEYDVLEALDFQWNDQQGSTDDGTRLIDVFFRTGGEPLHFEVRNRGRRER